VLERDPGIEAYKKDVDVSLRRKNLKLTVEERLSPAHETPAFRRRAKASWSRSARAVVIDFQALLGMAKVSSTVRI